MKKGASSKKLGKGASGKNLDEKDDGLATAKNTLSCYVNKDPSSLLPEEGGFRVNAEQVCFVDAENEVCKEWPWEVLEGFECVAGREKGEFDKFSFNVTHEGLYEVESETCDHFEGAFAAKMWDPRKYKCVPTKEQTTILQQAFLVFDADGSGELDTPEEVDRIMKLLGKKFIKKSKGRPSSRDNV
jgi:hypothetical protein